MWGLAGVFLSPPLIASSEEMVRREDVKWVFLQPTGLSWAPEEAFDLTL